MMTDPWLKLRLRKMIRLAIVTRHAPAELIRHLHTYHLAMRTCLTVGRQHYIQHYFAALNLYGVTAQLQHRIDRCGRKKSILSEAVTKRSAGSEPIARPWA